LKTQVEEFCNDPDRLRQFYAEEPTTIVRPGSTRLGPVTTATTTAAAAATTVSSSSHGMQSSSSAATSSAIMEASIPSLELPASLVVHPVTPSPDLDIPQPESSTAPAAAVPTTPAISATTEEKESNQTDNSSNKSPNLTGEDQKPVK
jgi:hypothetical protein